MPQHAIAHGPRRRQPTATQGGLGPTFRRQTIKQTRPAPAILMMAGNGAVIAAFKAGRGQVEQDEAHAH